jgi:hypothetical protein
VNEIYIFYSILFYSILFYSILFYSKNKEIAVPDHDKSIVKGTGMMYAKIDLVVFNGFCKNFERSREISGLSTAIRQFSSEMQQT